MDSINSEAAAKAVTVPQLLTLTAWLSVDDELAARYYCAGLAHVALLGGESDCAGIMLAGCIPHVIECLRRWPDEGNVADSACHVLVNLAKKGSELVRATIKRVPGVQATLLEVTRSGLSPDEVRALDALMK